MNRGCNRGSRPAFESAITFCETHRRLAAQSRCIWHPGAPFPLRKRELGWTLYKSDFYKRATSPIGPTFFQDLGTVLIRPPAWFQTLHNDEPSFQNVISAQTPTTGQCMSTGLPGSLLEHNQSTIRRSCTRGLSIECVPGAKIHPVWASPTTLERLLTIEAAFFENGGNVFLNPLLAFQSSRIQIVPGAKWLSLVVSREKRA